MKKYSVKDLTTEEKLRMLCSDGFWHTYDCDGKLPKVAVADGPMGLRVIKDNQTLPSIAYPSLQSLANTWSRALAKDMGESLADDCHERNVDVLLGPGVNVKRHPLNGRNFEYFSEDPYLAGEMGKIYVDALQNSGIGACVKHFCCNNLEYNRFEQSSEVDERTLHEIYYLPFEIACEANPVSMMSAYNKVNGAYANENAVGISVLREEFGFDGVMYSDWEAVRDRTASAKAGCDIEFPFNQKNYERLVEDYKNGKISDTEVDICVQRIINFVYKCQEMKEGKSIKNSLEARLRVAQTIAQESVVLLKNKDVLPLKDVKKIAVCGCFATPERDMISGRGSSQVDCLSSDWDLPKLIREKTKAEVLYEPMFWYDKVSGAIVGFQWTAKPSNGLENAKSADVSIICAGTGGLFEYESADREYMRLPKVQEMAILDLAKANENTVVVIFAGSAIDVSAWQDKVKGIVYAGYFGERGFEALADILLGKVNPSGKLSETFATCFEKTPVANTYMDTCITKYEEGIEVGYRYYDRHLDCIQYPFGHGLSYSVFEYANVEVKQCNEGVEVCFDIKNISATDGKEVAQIYVGEDNPKVFRPLKELKEFVKVDLRAGETKKVRVILNERAFAHYCIKEKGWKANEGAYTIYVGASSQDIRLQAKIVR